MKFKKIISMLPSKIRKHIVRKMMPEIDTELDGFRVILATGEDRSRCINLVNDVYVQTGYIKRDDAIFFRVSQHKLMSTKVFAVKKGDDLVATFTIFQDDKEYGLPMDIGFKEHVDFYRRSARKVVEVGCLATNPKYRTGNMSIPFLINKSSILYSTNVLGADNVMLTTHPKFKMVYEDLLLAKKVAEIKHFDYVDGNPAIAYCVDLKTLDSELKDVYCNFQDNKNIYKIIFGSGQQQGRDGMICENYYFGVDGAKCDGTIGYSCPAGYEEVYIPCTCPELDMITG